jgi:hypothetical protein
LRDWEKPIIRKINNAPTEEQVNAIATKDKMHYPNIRRAVQERLQMLRNASEWVQGGIDLNTTNGMQWKISKDGRGVEMDIDPALIERVRHEGINSLSPVILKMTPVASIWSLVGLQAPVKDGSNAIIPV